jgi:hypothetical protein
VRGVRKPFEKDVYDECDGPAKEAMRAHLEAQGHKVTVPDENYDVDLFSEVGDLTMYHEVEVSLGWKSGDHPYPKGSIPERKSRLRAMNTGRTLYFWMLRSDLRRAVVFSSVYLQDRFLIEVPNRKVASGEFFYRIPKSLGKEFNLLPINEEDVFDES